MTAGQLIGIGLIFLSLIAMVRVLNNLLKWVTYWHNGKIPKDGGGTCCCGCFVYTVLFVVMYLGIRWAGIL